MPTITAAFRRGELSYSKVREVTRVVDLVDEARLCKPARATSASQLARTIAGYRTAAGTRIAHQERRRFQLITATGDGMTRIIGQLPADESAIIAAAHHRARDHNSTPKDMAEDGEATPTYTDADAIRDICRHYLNTGTPDAESGEDRSLVIIQIAADQLLHAKAQHVPAGTSQAELAQAERASAATRWSCRPEEHVPAAPSPVEPAPADHRSLATPLVELSGAVHVPAGTSQVEPRPAGRPRIRCDAGGRVDLGRGRH